MKVLSVRQPWAWAIIHGGKDIENRNWETSYRGPLAIHAGQAFDFTKAEIKSALAGHYGNGILKMLVRYQLDHANDVRGAIIGVVDLVDCIPDRECNSPWKADGYDFFCWKLENPRALKTPMLWKGQLGLFGVPDEWFPADAFVPIGTKGGES